MIKFFRKIRQKLLSENKFSKYLIYTIGEILLVVIGILIAIQINNWNEGNKTQKEEIKLLKLLSEDFNENKKRIKTTIGQEKSMIDYSKKLIYIMESKNTSVGSDSIIKFIGKGAKSWWRAEFVTGTYDAIIGSGKINTLSDNGLKRLLAQFSAEVKSGFEDHYESINYIIELNKISASYKSEFLRDEQLMILGMNKNTDKIDSSINKIINNDSFKGLLIAKTWMENNRLEYQNKIQGYIDEILLKIEYELKK